MSTEFAPHDLTTPTSHSPFVVTSSAHWANCDEFQAFDGGTSLFDPYWAFQGSSGTPWWITLDIGAGNRKILTGYNVVTSDSTTSTRAPKAWTVQGSNNDSDWDVLDTVVDQTSWGDEENRAFVPDVATTAYRYFKIVVTETQSDATYCIIGELYYQGNDPVPEDDGLDRGLCVLVTRSAKTPPFEVDTQPAERKGT